MMISIEGKAEDENTLQKLTYYLENNKKMFEQLFGFKITKIEQK